MPCSYMAASISAYRRHLLHEHAQSLSLRGGVETYSTISPSDARRRVLLDSVRQGGRAAFRQRLREELASTPTLSPTAEHLGAASSAADFVYFVSTPDVRSGADHSTPTVPRPADYVTSPQTSLSSLSTGGNTNDTDFDMEFSLDWSPVEFPKLFGERFGRVFPPTSAEEAPLCSSVRQITVIEDWDTEAIVEQSIDSTSPVLVVPPDVMIVDVVAPQRPVSPPPPPPPEPFWERPLKRTASCYPVFGRFVGRNTSSVLQHHCHELNRCF